MIRPAMSRSRHWFAKAQKNSAPVYVATAYTTRVHRHPSPSTSATCRLSLPLRRPVRPHHLPSCGHSCRSHQKSCARATFRQDLRQCRPEGGCVETMTVAQRERAWMQSKDCPPSKAAGWRKAWLSWIVRWAWPHCPDRCAIHDCPCFLKIRFVTRWRILPLIPLAPSQKKSSARRPTQAREMRL